MNKFTIIIIILMVILSLIIIKKLTKENQEIKPSLNSDELYQGPVPEGYNESYFRHTGKLKKLGGNN